MTTETNRTDLNNWVTPRILADEHPQFPEKTVQWWLRNRHANGLAEHVRKLGKHLYISKSGFTAWINNAPSH